MIVHRVVLVIQKYLICVAMVTWHKTKKNILKNDNKNKEIKLKNKIRGEHEFPCFP